MLGLYAAILTNPEYAKTYPFTLPEGFCFKAIVLNCGVYNMMDPSKLDGPTMPIMKDFLPGGATEEELYQISTVNFITEDYPPTFYMTCTGDFLKNQAPVLEEQLLEKNIPHEFHYFGDAKTELGHVFHLNMRSEEASRCNDIECDYFRRFL